MVSFQTKNPNLGKFCRDLDWKMLIYFVSIWNILKTLYDHLGYCMTILGYCMPIWYIFSGSGIMYQEKSGNPGLFFTTT
jgi:hypothetical protein